MKIYTKTGDKGQTSLFGGKRVEKNNLRIEAYGTIDELNSIIGVVLAEGIDEKGEKILTILQNELFILGGELATPDDVEVKTVVKISDADIEFIENSIDDLEKDLEPLKYFILPGGNKAASLLHLARTVCRRAERIIISVSKDEKISSKVIIFVNRLSDFLFVLARYQNHIKSTPEIKWKPRG
jgi:cob(I)alamin adenosyltransferase